MLGYSPTMTKAMILAAGFGTRLRPLSLELPKPLVWVGDRPAIAHIAERLVAAGITEIVVNTHHRAEAFSPDLLARVPGRLSIVTEPEILGTGGGLANAAPLLGEGDVVVWNGDILTPLDVTALLAAAARETGADSKRQKDEPPRGGPFAKLPGAGSPEGATPSIKGATLAIVPRPRGQGTVGIDAGGFVVRLRGERFGEEVAGGDFLGVSVVTEALRRTLPIPGCLVGEGMLPWLRSGGTIGTFRADVTWEDIGSVDAYLRANARWLHDTGRSSFTAATAHVAPGIETKSSVIGEGATVTGEGLLEGCVIWPGAVARAPATRTVFTTGGLTAQPD